MEKRLLGWELMAILWTLSIAVAVSLMGEMVEFAPLANLLLGEGTVFALSKAVFVPWFLFSLLQMMAQGNIYPHFLAVRSLSTLVAVAVVPVSYYTYSGVMGMVPLEGQWLVMGISVCVGAWLDWMLLHRRDLAEPWQQILGLCTLWAMAFAFVWW